MTEEERIKELVGKEVAHVQELLEQDLNCENVSDAAATLASAANRLAPPGHVFRFVHDEFAIERERHTYVAEAR